MAGHNGKKAIDGRTLSMRPGIIAGEEWWLSEMPLGGIYLLTFLIFIYKIIVYLADVIHEFALPFLKSFLFLFVTVHRVAKSDALQTT